MRVIGQYLNDLQAVLQRTPRHELQHVVDVLSAAYRRGSRIYIIGNGGSAATASHFVCDLTKNTAWADAPRFRAFALVDNTPSLTAWSNDADYASALAQQVVGVVERGDVVVIISGSGNSPNVLRAAEVAREAGAITIGFTGASGGRLKDLADVCVHVASDRMPMIEDVHVVLMHALCEELREMVRDMAVGTMLKGDGLAAKVGSKGEGEAIKGRDVGVPEAAMAGE